MNTRALPIALTLALGLAASAHAADKLNVTTTTTDLKSLVEAVGGDRVAVTSIAGASQDPHFVEAKPSYMLAARKADLFVELGLELEIGWAPPIIDGSRNEKIRPGSRGFLDASATVDKLEVPTGTVDRSQGDIHPYGNPHYWLDPWNGRQVAGAVAAKLSELSPADASTFSANLAAFQRKLDAAMFGQELVDAEGGDRLWDLARRGDVAAGLATESATRAGKPPLPALGGWAAKLAPYRGGHVMTYHRSWPYLFTRFGIVITDQIEPKPGIPPTPSHLLELIDKAKADKVGAILVEPWYSDQAAQLIASKTGARVLRLPLSVGAVPESKDYVSHLDFLVGAVAQALATPPSGS